MRWTPVTRMAVVVALAGPVACSEPAGDRPPGPAGSACPAAYAAAEKAVARAESTQVTWTGPTTGPRAANGKTIYYVAQTMTNPGVAGVAKGVEDAAGAIGWNLQIVDGEGTPEGIRTALEQTIRLKPSGIVIGGFDPGAAAGQLQQAAAAGITLIGWHAADAPGPDPDKHLFTNITTKVGAVATISAQWTIKQSGGRAGVVVFTDNSIPFAKHKSELIQAALTACAGMKILATEDIPIPEASILTPQRVGTLLDRFGDAWTNSVAINDLYFADAAAALRDGGKEGADAPFNVGAGDGDPLAFRRIRDRQYQAATVPEPLLEQGWQIVDEFNRAFAGQPDSGYVPPTHLTTIANVGRATYWEPDNDYRAHYAKIWGR